MNAECALNELFLEICLGYDGGNRLLIRLNFLYVALQIYFKLRVLFRVMAEEKCFCWLDAAAQPADKVCVVDARLQPFCVQLDQNFKQCEIKVFLLRSAKIFCKRFSSDEAAMTVVNRQEGLPHRVEIQSELRFQGCV